MSRSIPRRPRHEQFLRDLKIKGDILDVMLRLALGDRIEFEKGRMFLRSAELTERATVELRKGTVDALRARALIYECESAEGDYEYRLTDDGELAAKLLSDQKEHEPWQLPKKQFQKRRPWRKRGLTPSLTLAT